MLGQDCAPQLLSRAQMHATLARVRFSQELWEQGLLLPSWERDSNVPVNLCCLIRNQPYVRQSWRRCALTQA